MTDLNSILKNFTENVSSEFIRYKEIIDLEYLRSAAEMIHSAQLSGNRVHITGIGKPHHVASYMASLLSSIGTPCYLLDGTEAVHGSSGQVLPGDVVICISYYGNVPELIPTMHTLRKNGAHMISLTGFDSSVIAQLADIHINCFVSKEGDPLGKPPRTSMLITMYILMALSLLLQELNEMDPDNYIRFHPAGQLGKKAGEPL